MTRARYIELKKELKSLEVLRRFQKMRARGHQRFFNHKEHKDMQAGISETKYKIKLILELRKSLHLNWIWKQWNDEQFKEWVWEEEDVISKSE